MKVLIVGGGGREHALAWQLPPGRSRRSSSSLHREIPGIAELATLRRPSRRPTSMARHRAARVAKRVDLHARRTRGAARGGHRRRGSARAGSPIFGPTRAAAMIESSKAFRQRRSCATPASRPPRGHLHHRSSDARGAPSQTLRRAGRDQGVRARRRKGRRSCARRIEQRARGDRRRCSSDDAFGDAGREMLVEEFMEGEELSLFAITDGERAIPLLPAQDHKRLLDGIAARTPAAWARTRRSSLGERRPTPCRLVMRADHRADARARCATRGAPFTGLLYAGADAHGRRPEGRRVQLPLRRSRDAGDAAGRCAASRRSLELIRRVAIGRVARPSASTSRQPAHAVTTVVAAARLSRARRATGDAIALPRGAAIMCSSFTRAPSARADGDLVTAGGRVLAVTGARRPRSTTRSARSLGLREPRRVRGKAVPLRHRLARAGAIELPEGQREGAGAT